MKSLFEAILLIVSFTAIFLFYYLLKRWLQNFKEKKNTQKRLRIIIEEKRAQWYLSLRVALAKMKIDQVLWAEIYIHGKNEERLSIECSPGIDLWKFKFRHMNLSREIQLEFKKYGRYINSVDENLDEIECHDSEQLLECIFYFLDRIIQIDGTADIKLKY